MTLLIIMSLMAMWGWKCYLMMAMLPVWIWSYFSLNCSNRLLQEDRCHCGCRPNSYYIPKLHKRFNHVCRKFESNKIKKKLFNYCRPRVAEALAEAQEATIGRQRLADGAMRRRCMSLIGSIINVMGAPCICLLLNVNK